MKKGLLLSIMLLAAVLVVGCQSKEVADNDMKEEPLKVGMELKYPPFEYKDDKGNPIGASVDLAKGLGEYLGREITIVDTPYPSLIPALETGKVDIIISSMTITEAREKKVDFSDPYTTSQLTMLVHKESPVASYSDLNDPSVTIVSKTGTIGALWAAANAPEATIKNVDEEATAVLEVSRGTADVFIYDPLSVIRHHENYLDTTKALLEPLPNTKGWGIAMKKDQDVFKEEVNSFLKEAKENGLYDEIRDNHLQDKIQEFKKYNLEFFF